MDTMTPEETRRRFGEILHAATRTHREFDGPMGGIWRPVFLEGELTGYRLYQLHKVKKRRPSIRTRGR